MLDLAIRGGTIAAMSMAGVFGKDLPARPAHGRSLCKGFVTDDDGGLDAGAGKAVTGSGSCLMCRASERRFSPAAA